ncbi:MAG TPA: Hsp20/alpha crystallin family protein [Armatimonadota bacterium]
MGSLIRWEPLTDLTRLRREMNRLLEDFFGEGAEETTPAEMMRVPNVDVVNRDNEIVVRAEMPGIDKDNIQIQAMPEALMIRAEMKKEAEEKAGNYLRRERRVGMFQRIIPLPAEVKANEVKASYKDGVLEVDLPKTDQAKSQQPVRVKVE